MLQFKNRKSVGAQAFASSLPLISLRWALLLLFAACAAPRAQASLRTAPAGHAPRPVAPAVPAALAAVPAAAQPLQEALVQRAAYRVGVTALRPCTISDRHALFAAPLPPGTVHVGIEVQFENQTTDTDLVLVGSATLEDARAYRYEHLPFSGLIAADDCEPFVARYDPGAIVTHGQRVRGWFRFRVPTGTEAAALHVTIYTRSDWEGSSDEAHPEELRLVIPRPPAERQATP